MNLDPILLFAFIEVESGFDRGAFLNDKNGGSRGLMQVDVATVKDRGFSGEPQALYNPMVNVEYGAKILVWIADELEKHGKFSIDNLAAAYNAGLAHVLGGGTDMVYSAKITQAYARWKAALPVEMGGSIG